MASHRALLASLIVLLQTTAGLAESPSSRDAFNRAGATPPNTTSDSVRPTGLHVVGALSGSSANIYGPFAEIVAADHSRNTTSGGANQALLTQLNIAPDAGAGSKSSITSILNFQGQRGGPLGGFYTSIFGQTYMNGGVRGARYGDFYGMAALVQAACDCDINGVTGEEVDVGLFPKTKASYKYGLRVIGVNGDNTHAASSIVPPGYGVYSGTEVVQEAMVALTRDANTKVGWYCGICFGSVGSYWPIDEEGTILGVQPVSLENLQSGKASQMKALHGIDLSAVTFGDDFLKSKGFSVNPAGYTSAARYHSPLHSPKSSSEACVAGDFADDANYHYVCVADNKWKRVLLSDF